MSNPAVIVHAWPCCAGATCPPELLITEWMWSGSVFVWLLFGHLNWWSKWKQLGLDNLDSWSKHRKRPTLLMTAVQVHRLMLNLLCVWCALVCFIQFYFVAGTDTGSCQPRTLLFLLWMKTNVSWIMLSVFLLVMCCSCSCSSFLWSRKMLHVCESALWVCFSHLAIKLLVWLLSCCYWAYMKYYSW